MTVDQFKALKPGDKVRYRHRYMKQGMTGRVVEVGHAATVFKWEGSRYAPTLISLADYELANLRPGPKFGG